MSRASTHHGLRLVVLLLAVGISPPCATASPVSVVSPPVMTGEGYRAESYDKVTTLAIQMALYGARTDEKVTTPRQMSVNGMQSLLLRLIIMGVAALTSTMAFDSNILREGQGQGSNGNVNPNVHVYINNRKNRRTTAKPTTDASATFRMNRIKKKKKMRPNNYNDDFGLQNGRNPGGSAGQPSPPAVPARPRPMRLRL